MGRLRVIGGTAKGKKLISVPSDTTRPITDRVKESLFNIIGGDIRDSRFLDLFAGTGAVGIEALSRGARYALFLDKAHQAIQTIKKNLESTRFREQADVQLGDSLKYVNNEIESVFDYIYIAPPQYKEMWEKAMYSLNDNLGLLSEDGWIVVQIHPIEYKQLDITNLEEFDMRTYGSTMLVFYQKIV